MKAYKGFDEDLVCNYMRKTFQYKLKKTYEEPKANLGKCGFHACETPTDVFSYQAPCDGRYCEVTLDDVTDQHDVDDSQRVGKKITIDREIGVDGIVSAAIKFISKLANWKTAKKSDKDH